MILGRSHQRSRLLVEVSQEGAGLLSVREWTNLGDPFCRIESGMFGVNADSMESLNVYRWDVHWGLTFGLCIQSMVCEYAHQEHAWSWNLFGTGSPLKRIWENMKTTAAKYWSKCTIGLMAMRARLFNRHMKLLHHHHITTCWTVVVEVEIRFEASTQYYAYDEESAMVFSVCIE